MIDYRPDACDNRRITTQIIPDDTNKFVRFRSEIGLDGYEEMPLVAWAVVITLQSGAPPIQTLEPVVDDRCHGPIALGDLELEVGPLTLLEVE
ncbi:hypothetical protein [Actinacidiphila sp. ITFR-21]|uniref:hypothetical protein n=1 Tax=Actinacidiphila sp. ITFR-21 TaxID=3075199 RepID=UPI00288A2EE5|nr:hypothetical protein [Streptomyces sp. ITFR-21]WNI17600.1 hypothetical protein RLT57_20135 [Streptomyces sp. ITFR-21]WNI17740.1 hypothetical protein RLT57_20850 [Streptomyces sp. ITFR-21]